MGEPELDIVTGATSYTGKYITRRLLAMGRQVRTLTGHPGRPDPFGGQVRALPYAFGQPEALAESLRGASTLYNTYWVRFPHGRVTYEGAVENGRALFEAAQRAGLRRVVHVSIANPSADSPLPYYRGKAALEAALVETGLSHAILRPTVIFGLEDILINNLAWLLRRFPVFGVPGRGDYRLQPIYVEDMAELAVNAGQRDGNEVLDAVGPETYTFDALLRLIAETVGSRARLVHVSPGLAMATARLLGPLVGDVLLTRDELRGLMADLLVSDAEPVGKTRLSAWLADNAARVGARYASELNRHYRRGR